LSEHFDGANDKLTVRQAVDATLLMTRHDREALKKALGEAIRPFLGSIPTLALYREAMALATTLKMDFMAGLDGSIPGLGPAALKAVELEIEADIEATTEASRR